MINHRGKEGSVVKEKGLAGVDGGWHRVDKTEKGGVVSSEARGDAQWGGSHLGGEDGNLGEMRKTGISGRLFCN